MSKLLEVLVLCTNLYRSLVRSMSKPSSHRVEDSWNDYGISNYFGLESSRMGERKPPSQPFVDKSASTSLAFSNIRPAS